MTKKLELLRIVIKNKMREWVQISDYAKNYKKYDNLSLRDIDEVFKMSQEKNAWYKYF